MKLSNQTKIDILEINLDSLNFNKKDSLIIIDEKTLELGLRYLENMERYEDCQKLIDNKCLFVSKIEIF